MKVVVRSLPFHRRTDEAMKFVPVAVRVNPAPPAVTLVGEIELSVGTGLLIVNVCALERPPPGVGLKIMTGAVPGVAMSFAEIAARSSVLLKKVVDRAVPFHRTTDEAMKFVPVAIRVNPAPPAATLVGEIELSVGAGLLLIVNVCALEAPPPGVGLKTVTGAVPAVATSFARICAWSWVLLTKVVVLLTPFQRTTDAVLKFVPVAISGNAALPATALVGEIELSVGAGLLIVNVEVPEVPPPGVGLKTVTVAVPVAAMSFASIWAWSWVLLTKVVVRVVPFQRTTEVMAKLVPVVVSVRVALATAAVPRDGAIDVGAGLVFVMVIVKVQSGPRGGGGLIGVGVNTVTDAVPVVAISAAVI